MFITKLEVVNGCLATLGEAGLTDMQEDHAYKETALQFLREETDRIAARAWWFNQENVWMKPDATSGFIYVPNDVYSIISLNQRGFSITQMGNRLYNARTRSFQWQAPVAVKLTRKFDFEELPYHASAAIRDAAILKFQGRIDADRVVLDLAGRTAQMSWEELLREDTRHQKHNMLIRPGMSPHAYAALDNFHGGMTSPLGNPHIQHPY